MYRTALSGFRHYSTRNPLPATFLRGGTSKGIFLKRSDLPEDQAKWDPIFLGMMGSPDPEHARQLNGMGGGISSLSKICVIGSPSTSKQGEVDVEYTFVQVGIRDSTIDYSGNCGNLSSMIGVFALDEGLCNLPDNIVDGSVATVRMFNTNTNKYINTTFPVVRNGNQHAASLELDEVIMAGVPGKASQITLDFVSPGGARTGKLLPTGNPVDTVEFQHHDGTKASCRVSLVDATNPTVFILSSDLQRLISLPNSTSSPLDFASPDVLRILEHIRQGGAQLMALDPSAQSQPKIAILSHPDPTSSRINPNFNVDIFVHALSMGVLHKAVPMTVGLCLGVAAGVEGTLASDIVKKSRSRADGDRRGNDDGFVKIEHPSGIVDVGADFGSGGEVLNAKVVRTGRRLMKGVVWW